MSKIIISWDYGLRLLNDMYLVTELNRLRNALSNFNWDYIMVPNSDGSYRKEKDFDRIEQRHDWLTKAIPELEKMCKERGIGEDIISAPNTWLATRLNDFYKDYDYYDYMDSIDSMQPEEVIAEIEGQLSDFMAVKGILNALKDIKDNAELDQEQAATLDGLIKDVTAFCAEPEPNKSIDEKIINATERSSVTDNKDARKEDVVKE